MVQKPLLPPKSSPIADHPAAGADDPVTGDDDGDGIAPVGLPDGPGCGGLSHCGGYIPVRDRPPAGNPEQMPPDLLLKVCSFEIELQPKGFPAASKIFIDLRNGLS